MALAAAAFAALLSLIPYLIAWRAAPAGSIFSGFLINPQDGFSYLAKMQQGIRGSWLFRLPYAVEPGPPAFIFTFYLALGHISRLVGARPIVVFHLTRMLAMIVMGLAAYRFLGTVLKQRGSVLFAYLLFLFGSGLGWLAGPLGFLTSDLLIPESIPFYAGLVNPHFPLAYAGVASGAVLVLAAQGGWRTWASSFAVGLVLALLLPFALLSLLAVLLVWQLWEAWEQRGQLSGHLRRGFHAELGALVALGVGGGPLLAYDFLLTRSHPVLMLWNAQNQTPSPPLPSYLIGFGLPLLLAGLGAVRFRIWRQRQGRLLLLWVLVNFLLLYAPFNLQRRLSLGLFLPLTALAALGLQPPAGQLARRWLPALMIALALPSNALAMLAGVSQVLAGDPALLLAEGELSGYRWLADHLHGRPTALAAPVTGNRLPAYADVGVLYGHPFETPQAEARRNEIVDFYAATVNEEALMKRATDLGADLIVFGPHEAAIGRPVGLSSLPSVYSREGFAVWAVPAP